MPVKIKRIYEPPSNADGYRVLVDRLWPRGVKKDQADINLWLKEVAPSTVLRKWVHGGGDWQQFRLKYHEELKNSPALQQLKNLMEEHKAVTLLYAAKDEHHNHALVLQELIDK
ncbi:uncharacterized protein YeaO (DUF488 family) [Mucilaginibacter yixingensis]|uniref:Uncharacterized protein YeaO (DUF488 family) n=1 Tax=Mucilaginibacter yixingensis TaxID=1295612 RepID=A0A2T5J9W4_9SPHI|nr:DUF488 family protein [Mucilaginibacter yixingensis]PTQ96824.1 uncharacterized protein YeaO (DUF488 family) [Mucilaginibacter yixingensis]